MLSRLDLDMALTGNVEIARDMRDIAQEKMTLMKLQIQVLQNKTSTERTAATSNTDSSNSPLGRASTLPNLPLEEDDDEVTENDSEHDQPTQGAGSGAAAQPAQELPGVPIDAG